MYIDGRNERTKPRGIKAKRLIRITESVLADIYYNITYLIDVDWIDTMISRFSYLLDCV